MPSASKRTFSLPDEQSHYIDEMVESGTYASGSEVVRAGLRALQERDAAVELWLRRDVAATYDKLKSGSTRAIPSADVFAAIRSRHAERKKKTA